jgi:hypothetical protein
METPELITTGVCGCCNYEGIPVKEYTISGEYDIRNGTKPEPRTLCMFCSHTFISGMVNFPSQSAPGVIGLAQSLGWIANRILAEIKAGKVS